MRFGSTRAVTLACVALVGLAAPLAAPGQNVPGPGRGHWGHHPPIPRTYSYYYNYRFNQPRHSRVVAPDGRVFWRSTVRGLPLGAPWPPY